MTKQSKQRIAEIVGVVFTLVLFIGIGYLISRALEYDAKHKFGCIDSRTPAKIDYSVSGVNIDNYYIEFSDGTAERFNNYTLETPIVGKPLCIKKGYLPKEAL